MPERELDVGPLLNDPRLADAIALRDAIDLASDQDTTTWLTDGGKRIAAIVPVDVAEAGDSILAIHGDRERRLREELEAQLPPVKPPGHIQFTDDGPWVP